MELLVPKKVFIDEDHRDTLVDETGLFVAYAHGPDKATRCARAKYIEACWGKVGFGDEQEVLVQCSSHILRLLRAAERLQTQVDNGELFDGDDDATARSVNALDELEAAAASLRAAVGL